MQEAATSYAYDAIQTIGAGTTPVLCRYDVPLPQYAEQQRTKGYKFTGKERDSETGLDYFGTRYYGSNMGRFVSPDWSAAPTPVPYADLTDPQTLNLYGYVRNNPLAKIDPDGHDDDEPLDGVGKEITNSVIGLYNLGNRAATKVSNLLSGRNDQPRQEPLLTPSSRAQGTVMTLTGLALMLIPESRAEWADVQIERAATKIENIGTRNLTNETLQAASREVNGGMAVAKTGGGQFSHVTKVEQAIGGLNKQINHLEKVLKKTGLSEAQVGKINAQLDKARGLLKVAQKAITRDPI
jgi:RHS repeat-associated protein